MEPRDLIAIDIAIPVDKIDTGGIAYYRIPVDFRDFLIKCMKQKGVIGFEYDFDSLNFGVILKSEEEIPKTEKEKELEKKLNEKEKEIKDKIKK